jgi:hypothetical protein
LKQSKHLLKKKKNLQRKASNQWPFHHSQQF